MIYNLYISQYLGLQISKSSEFSSLKMRNSETKIVNWVNNGGRLIGRTYDKQPLLTSKSRGRLIRGSTYTPGSTVSMKTVARTIHCECEFSLKIKFQL